METIKVKDIIPCFNVYRSHGGSLDALDYEKVAYKAMKYIEFVTLGRALEHVSDDEDILYCHAELCDQYAAIASLQARVNAAKDITRETVGPHSVQYATAAEALQQAQDGLYPIVKRYLIKYMYRGVPYV